MPEDVDVTTAASQTGSTDGAAAFDVARYCDDLATRAGQAAATLATVSGKARDEALRTIAAQVRDQSRQLLDENAKDLEAGNAAGLTSAMLDRLTLDNTRIEKIAKSVEDIADQPDPLGQIIEQRELESGIHLQKVRVPIGVILIIYESRPNVTSDAAALCLKSGNATILRGGKEAMHTNAALAKCVRMGLEAAGLSPDAVQLVSTTDRAAVGELLKMDGRIDLCIPRGGESLIRAVVEQAHIPVIKHYTGNCHTYVDAEANQVMSVAMCVNAKVQRPGVCNATETFLFHRDHVESGLLARVCEALASEDVEIRADEATRGVFETAKPATEDDWYTEYLDLICAVKVVDSVDDAIAHVNKYGSKHTDAILTANQDTAEKFIAGVDTANVMVNCSTRFSDGGEYGLGAEIGISTDKLHARGPMGAADLTSYKWVARGSGQLRK